MAAGRVLAAVVLTVLASAGCGKRDDRGAAAPPTPPAAATAAAAPAAAVATEARSLFASRCAMCHGATGKGDGPAAGSINPPPRDYTDAAWQATVTDADLARVIVEGGGALGKSPMMPAGPDLRDKPAVVTELVAMIRGFAK